MKPTTNQPKSASETALLRELSVNGSPDRDQLLKLLCEQAPPPAREPVAMPDELRKRLEEKFGRPSGAAQPLPSAPAPRAKTAWLAQASQWLRETLAHHPLAFGGGLAAAACAVALLTFSQSPPSDSDVMRGGTVPPPVTAATGIHWCWLGAADAALQASLANIAGNAKFSPVANLAELPIPTATSIIIAIDPQYGTWLKRATGEPESYAAEGVPGSVEWPAALNKSAEAALAAANKK